MTYDARRQASQQQDVPKEGCQDGFGEAQYTLWNALRRVTPSSGTNLCRTTSRNKSWTKWEKQRERWTNSDIERLFWSGGVHFYFPSMMLYKNSATAHKICTHTVGCFSTEQLTCGSQMRKFSFIVWGWYTGQWVLSDIHLKHCPSKLRA